MATSQPMAEPTPVVPADAIPSAPSKPMSGKRKWALALWGSSLLGAGGGYYFNGKAVGYASDYDGAQVRGDYLLAQSAYGNINNAKTGRTAGYGASVATFLVGAVLWLLPEEK